MSHVRGVMTAAVGLYIHVPFCLKKCSYCDFVSYPLRPGDEKPYIEALSREIDLYSSALGPGEKKITSLFVGGGTPTCLSAAGLAAILEKAVSSFSLLPGCEVTVEANPGTVDLAKLRVLLEAGANRLSLGVQSFQDHLLAVLGRVHSAGEAAEAVRAARSAGFADVNLDLICGLPGQTVEDWLYSLQLAVELEPEHLAVYGLQLEEGTPLEGAVARGELEACPEEDELRMYLASTEFLADHGYGHYEISNFARPGRRCAHNLGYWLNRPYLGLGPAAHSYLRGERFSNEPSLEEYRKKLSRGEYPVVSREAVSPQIEMSETMFLGLRLIEGIHLGDFFRRFGRRAEDVYRKEIAGLSGNGLIEFAGDRLRLTQKGLPVANRVFREFV